MNCGPDFDDDLEQLLTFGDDADDLDDEDDGDACPYCHADEPACRCGWAEVNA